MQCSTQLAQEELQRSQEDQRRRYDVPMKLRSFEVGQQVLLLLPSSSNNLFVQWQGPDEDIKWVGDANYQIRVPRQGNRLYHINLFKGCNEHEEPGLYNAEIDWDGKGREQSWELQAQVATGLPASEWQICQIQQVLENYPDVFWDAPGKVRGVEHHIPTPPGWVVPFRPTPMAMKEVLEKEVQLMLALGIIEESTNP